MNDGFTYLDCLLLCDYFYYWALTFKFGFVMILIACVVVGLLTSWILLIVLACCLGLSVVIGLLVLVVLLVWLCLLICVLLHLCLYLQVLVLRTCPETSLRFNWYLL